MAIVKFSRLALVFAVAACAHAETAEKATSIHGVNLSLSSSSNACLLLYNGKTIDLGIREKCFFLKDTKGRAVAKYYEDLGASVVLVAGGKLDLSGHLHPPVYAKPESCGQQARGVLVSQDGVVSLSGYSSSGMILCPGSKVDEKVYWLFGHKALP